MALSASDISVSTEVTCRPVWLTANTTAEEWRDYLHDVRGTLRDRMSSLLTVIALTDLKKSKAVQQSLTQGGQCALRWSQLRETVRHQCIWLCCYLASKSAQPLRL